MKSGKLVCAAGAIVLAAAVALVLEPWAQTDGLTITTWNVETLGGTGRGFASGFGKGNLGPRNNDQLQDIAALIRNKLHSDILALQEISIARIDNGVSINEKLDEIVAALGTNWKYYIPEVDQVPHGHENMFCAYLWNNDRVRLLDGFTMDLPNYNMCGAELYDRLPLVGYFEVINGSQGTNDPS